MSPAGTDRALRIALIAGSLGRAGAEKQLFYIATALRDSGADVRIYAVTRGEYYESLFRAEGMEPRWFGQSNNPIQRLARLTRALCGFRPDIVQSAHFFANLYAGMAGRACGALTIGAMRNDAQYELADNPGWGRLLLRAPAALVVNSHAAVEGAVAAGVSRCRIHCLPNVIDLAEFDRRAGSRPEAREPRAPVVVAVGRLVRAKRFDRFLEAFAIAQQGAPQLTGALIGDGPERIALERRASELNLGDRLTFRGSRDDVPAQLRQADMLALSSDHEGFPNVVLEAMSASLPVVTTPAGDAGRVVVEGVTGFVVPFERPAEMADRIVRLAVCPELRERLGTAGRLRAEEEYSYERLGVRLLDLYRESSVGSPRLRQVLA